MNMLSWIFRLIGVVVILISLFYSKNLVYAFNFPENIHMILFVVGLIFYVAGAGIHLYSRNRK